MGDWHNFVDETKACHGVDISTLAKPFAEEQSKYYLQLLALHHVLACRDTWWTGRFEAYLWDKNSWNNIQNKKGKQVYLGAYDTEEGFIHTPTE
ncbi:unnamed protein product [Lathyrus sativus]|nr:unnamed protein product [Lathyrus sativus]